jgi:hypothetical protein
MNLKSNNLDTTLIQHVTHEGKRGTFFFASQITLPFSVEGCGSIAATLCGRVASCSLFLPYGVLVELASNPELFWLPIATSHKVDPACVIKRIRRGAWQGGFHGFSRSDQCILQS